MTSAQVSIDGWGEQGRRFLSQGAPDSAIRCFRKALAQHPPDSRTLNDLGIAQKNTGDPAGAARAYRRAHAVDPMDVAPLNNLANALAAAGDRAGACCVLRDALRRAPWFAEGHQNLGDHLRHLKHLDEAATALRSALALKPDLVPSHISNAALTLTLGDAATAIVGYRRALALAPSVGLHSDLLFALTYDSSTTVDVLFAEHLHWARRYARVPAAAATQTIAAARNPDRLRIGYVSADLHDHPVARNLIGLVEAHDRRKYEIVLYPEIHGRDAVTAAFQALADGWRPTQGLSDRAVADLVRQDRIDVLVFVAGHTGMNRIALAAHGAAPVQVSIYAPSTTGIPAVDAWLTDPVLSPVGGAERFVERLVRLPCLYLHQPPAHAPPPVAREGDIVFASFNNPAKHTPEVYRLWARVLSAMPRSRLRLKYRGVYETPSLRRRIIGIFEGHGIDASRLEFVTEKDTREAHLAGFADIDIALDPFPFNGCNTTFEALWMGVPVVTLAGDRFLSRMSASFLVQVGLSDLVAQDDDSYVDAAARLATNASLRAELRTGLRGRVSASRLCDKVAHARAIEEVYSKLWREKVGAPGASS